MPAYLSQEWLDAGRELAQEFPERAGATARLQYQVLGSPEGDVHYYWVVENGKLQESTLGDDPDAEITLSMSYEDAVKMQKGELDANAAFMQGRIKVVPGSNMGKLMSLLPLTQSAEYKAIQAKIDAITDY
ncbi:MAG TPA: SCP2 sterol-binding domain-containing protein [Acidimicrobiales bacterium]|jgi:putative sterol carrier protein|nr:SCP2 sterol-binding domain-containing protein [Acidimicrobiales bacterium]